jgi:hypothetical protein
VDYLSVLREEKRRTGSDSGAGEQTQQKKTCRTSSDIGAEQENHNVGRGPTLDRKGLRELLNSIAIIGRLLHLSETLALQLVSVQPSKPNSTNTVE